MAAINRTSFSEGRSAHSGALLRLQLPPAPVFESLPSCALFSLYCRINHRGSIEWDYILPAAVYSTFIAF